MRIDACAFHEWASPLTLVPYMTEGWGRMILRDGDPRGMLNPKSIWRYENPLGSKALETYPEAGPPGSDRELLVRQLFADGRRERVVLGYHEGILATAFPQPHVVTSVVRAANDWTIAEWLEADDRLYGQVLVASALPDEAASEIRRVGAHERMVAVALGTNGLGRHFGHPVYRPIHEAAAELDLPLVIQVGCDAATDLVSLPVGGGLPATFSEYDVHSAQALMAHAGSFVTEGVFDLYPNLRVLLHGGGVAWVPWFLWNMNYIHRMVRPVETPWLSELPSEIFERHVRLTTWSLESPEPDRLEELLSTIPGIESALLYASGYPSWDWEEPEAIAARLPAAWHDRVFGGNAEELFRWPVGVPA